MKLVKGSGNNCTLMGVLMGDLVRTTVLVRGCGILGYIF